MSQHRTWDENQSPQWKYLFQKESARKRKTRKDLDKELHEKLKEENEKYNKMTKFGESQKKAVRSSISRKRKVSKEQLKAKLEATNNEIKKLLKNNNNDGQ